MIKVYSASEVSVVFGATNITMLGGMGENEFVSIATQGERYTYKAGVDGEGTRSEMLSNYVVVKITVMQTSAANAALSAMHMLDRGTPGGSAILPIAIADLQGGSILKSSEAWITKWPDIKYAKEVGEVEWEIGVNQPDMFHAGN